MNVYHVGIPSGYPDIASALLAIGSRSPAPSAFDRVAIALWPGAYDCTPFGTLDVPSYTSLSAALPTHDAIQVWNDTAPLFRCVGNYVGFHGFTIYTPAATDQYAILGNDQSRIMLDRLRVFSTGASKQGRFFKQSGPSWTNVGVVGCVVNALTTTKGALANEEGIVMLENTSGSTRWVDAWLFDCFLDCHAFTADGNVLAVHKCDDVRLHASTLRAMTAASTGRAALITLQSRVEFNNCRLEGKKHSLYVGSGGGLSTADVYNTEGKGRFGGPTGGGGVINNHFSTL